MPRLHRRLPNRLHNPARSHADKIPDHQHCPSHKGKNKLARCLACTTIFCSACSPGPCPTCQILPVWEEKPMRKASVN